MAWATNSVFRCLHLSGHDVNSKFLCGRLNTVGVVAIALLLVMPRPQVVLVSSSCLLPCREMPEILDDLAFARRSWGSEGASGVRFRCFLLGFQVALGLSPLAIKDSGFSFLQSH